MAFSLDGRYGSVSECLCACTPMVFLRRDYFNEEPFLRRLLQLHGGGADPAPLLTLLCILDICRSRHLLRDSALLNTAQLQECA